MPTKNTIGTNTTKNIRVQVKKDAKGLFILSFIFIKLKTGRKRPENTNARIIMDINGHISHVFITVEIIKSVKKNQKIIFREFLSRILPPKTKSPI
jgi:hypothetical protein